MKKNYIAPSTTCIEVRLTLLADFSNNQAHQNITVHDDEEADEFTARRRYNVWDDDEADDRY